MSKVLLVEDDINLREIYAARLNAEGYELVLAADGEEALSKAVSEKPSLILLDIMMPKISGFDVLDILRSTPETENTKVVMLSALSQESDKEHGEQLGVDKYLIKSQITLEDVVETVKELVTDTGSGGDQGSPIVTTSGRLPDKKDANNDGDTETTSAKQPPKQAAKKAAPKQPQQTKPNQAADEINDIDTQMQQNDDNSQQNASTDQQGTDGDDDDQNASQTQQDSANTQQSQTQDQQNTTQ